MLTKEDLQAISELMATQKKEIVQECMHNTQILIENTVIPRFNLLDEKVGALREKMIPLERLEKVIN